MKQFSALIVLLLLTITCFSQGPEKAIGIRGGLSSGFEYRVFASELTSYKVLLSTRQQGIQVTGLKEFHVPQAFDFSDEISFIYGFGAHVGFESWNIYRYYETSPFERFSDRKTGPVAGLDGLAAAEYTLPQIPLVFGFEVKPYFNLFGRNFFHLQPFDFAFTVKYTF